MEKTLKFKLVPIVVCDIFALLLILCINANAPVCFHAEDTR